MTEYAKENGKKPKRIEKITVRGRTLSWLPTDDDDIVGFRIYRFDPETNETSVVGSVASFSNSFAFRIFTDGEYFVTAVDVIGNESSPSQTIAISGSET